MIKTLIIDDNKIIREYFQTMIDWGARGFSLCAVANNGIMGWQEFSRHRPDVVITDVQMPGMSGLELSRKIREVSPDTLIIFISSYDNFNYVKDALEIGAFDYILKHETKGEKFCTRFTQCRCIIEIRRDPSKSIFHASSGTGKYSACFWKVFSISRGRTL